MLRAIIIEDEKHAADMLEKMLNDIEPAVNVLEKCVDLPTGVKSIKRNNPDIIFLDIELPVYSGIQLLDFFNTEEITFHIIFTTASNEYAVRAFEMSAADYLMKPIQEEKLKLSIERILMKQTSNAKELIPILKQNFYQDGNKKIVVPVSNGFEIVNLKNICYFKAEGSYTQIFLDDNTSLLVSKNLKHFEFILAGISGFLRIHRSYIANINFAKKIIRRDGSILFLDNKTELPVSDDKLDLVLEKLNSL